MPTQSITGADLHYIEQGKGMPLVLVHGYPLDHRIFAAQARDLAGTCRVILPDLRGFGRSTGTGPFTIASLADDLFELLTRIKALPCVLGGLSMGGYVALAYQERYANTLRGFILLDTRAEPDTAEGRVGRNASIELVKSKGSSAIAAQMLPKMFAGGTDSDARIKAELKSIMEACPALTIQHALAAMRDRPDFRPGLAKIVAPTLIVVGEGDAITPPSFAEGMAQQIRGSTLSIIPGAGHIASMEQPGAVSRAIGGFLRTINAG